jgi:hypothetical protein
MSVAAHLIQGSSEGKFRIIYCTPEKYKKDILAVGYEWGNLHEYMAMYKTTPSQIDPKLLCISNPALGLWTN